jgi:glucose 1-dehydrogenase
MCRKWSLYRTRHQGASRLWIGIFRIEPDFLIKVGASLGIASVLLEPASVVAKAWDHTERIGQRSRSWQPLTMLVTGADPVGLLAALIGAERGLDVHLLDHRENLMKRKLVRRLGGTYHSETLADVGIEPDILMECSGGPEIVRGVLGNTAGSGIVRLVGVTEPGHDYVNRLHYETAGEVLQEADKT